MRSCFFFDPPFKKKTPFSNQLNAPLDNRVTHLTAGEPRCLGSNASIDDHFPSTLPAVGETREGAQDVWSRGAVDGRWWKESC